MENNHICKKCGFSYQGFSCPNCGTKHSTEVICPKCGSRVLSELEKCPECGAQYSREETDFTSDNTGASATSNTTQPNQRKKNSGWKILIIALALYIGLATLDALGVFVMGTYNGYVVDGNHDLDSRPIIMKFHGELIRDADVPEMSYRIYGEDISIYSGNYEILRGKIVNGVMQLSGSDDDYYYCKSGKSPEDFRKRGFTDYLRSILSPASRLIANIIYGSRSEQFIKTDEPENDETEHTCSFTKQVANSEYSNTLATCESRATYFYSCECGARGNAVFSYGELADHVYNQKVTSTYYQKSPETNITGAIYYYSCKCGAKGVDTFSVPSSHTHSYDQMMVADTYLYSSASCDKRAKYYYSCVCGEAGNSTFEHGAMLNHTYDGPGCTELQECTVCGYVSSEIAGHNFNSKGVCTKCNASIGRNLSIPSAPITIANIYAGNDHTYVITSVSCEISNYSASTNTVSYKITVRGKNTGNDGSYACRIRWKVTDSSGTVIETDGQYSPRVSRNETFTSTFYVSGLSASGRYSLTFMRDT